MDNEKMIELLGDELVKQLDRELVDKFIENDKGDLVRVETYSLYEVAKTLVAQGYGHIPTAIRELAERVKPLISYRIGDEADDVGETAIDVCKIIDEIVKEYESK